MTDWNRKEIKPSTYNIFSTMITNFEQIEYSVQNDGKSTVVKIDKIYSKPLQINITVNSTDEKIIKATGKIFGQEKQNDNSKFTLDKINLDQLKFLINYLHTKLPFNNPDIQKKLTLDFSCIFTPYDTESVAFQETFNFPTLQFLCSDCCRENSIEVPLSIMQNLPAHRK
jgi:hypothetical protein